MTVYSMAEAAHQLSSVLEKAGSEGEVHIKNKEGRMFIVKPELGHSPLDVEGVDINISKEEIVAIIRESREE